MDEDLKLADHLARLAVGEVNELEDALFAASEAIIRLSAAAERERELREALRGAKRAENEWADMATNGLQWLRNIRDGMSTTQDALANMEECLGHCQSASKAARAIQAKEAS